MLLSKIRWGVVNSYTPVAHLIHCEFAVSKRVARMQRSEIRDTVATPSHSPDYVSLHPGYMKMQTRTVE